MKYICLEWVELFGFEVCVVCMWWNEVFLDGILIWIVLLGLKVGFVIFDINELFLKWERIGFLCVLGIICR